MTHTPPYYAVIFTSRRTSSAEDLYTTTATQIFNLAVQQPGYLGIESADEAGQGIAISYWDTLENIKKWRLLADHVVAQKMGRSTFYEEYRVRIAQVEREYGWERKEKDGLAEVSDVAAKDVGDR